MANQAGGVLQCRPSDTSHREIYCFTTVRFTWPGHQAGGSDYIRFGSARMPTNSHRWEWCDGGAITGFFTRLINRPVQSLDFQVFEPGEYVARFFKNGGIFSQGTLLHELRVTVKSSFKDLHIPQAQPGARFPVRWELFSPPMTGRPFQLLMESGTGEYLQSVAVTSSNGTADFVYPRADGAFRVVLRGTGSRTSELGAKGFNARIPPQHRATVTKDGLRALMARPGHTYHFRVAHPLFRPGDFIAVFPLRATDCADSPGRVLPAAELGPYQIPLSAECARPEGTIMPIRMPQPGAWGVSVVISYRNGQVKLLQAGGACCDLLVSLYATDALDHVVAPQQSAPGPGRASTPPPPIAYPIDAPEPPNEVTGSVPQCSVCLSADIATLIEPCRHACMCVECSEAVKRRNGLCPMCRQKIRSVGVVYFP
eukprot:Hpha_TRINITY_DN1203_c0_g1::TRINITY_DN1203_c0_g1_i1::g.44795::m.44795